MEYITWSQGIMVMIVTIVGMGLGVGVSYFIYNRVLRPLQRAFSARRKQARHVFYTKKYPLIMSVLKNCFIDYNGWADRVALTVLFCLYRSWFYKGFSVLLSDVENNAVDFVNNLLAKQVVEDKVYSERKNKTDSKKEKDKKIICEYAKTCENRFYCILATPGQYSGDDRSGCPHFQKRVDLVLYNSSAGVSYVRCAAALIRKCWNVSCEHFGPHEYREPCRYPHIKHECLIRKEEDMNTLHLLDRKNLLHCVISDASVDLNMSFKRKKEDE